MEDKQVLLGALEQLRPFDPTPGNPNDSATILAIPGGLSSSGLQSRDADTRTYMLNATNRNRPDHIVAGDVDIISLHFYANEANTGPATSRKLSEKWDRVIEGLRDNFRSKDRWITEIGFPSRPRDDKGTPNPATQDDRVMAAYVEYAKRPLVDTFIVHRIFDADRPDQPATDEFRKFGVIDHNLFNPVIPQTFTPKPAYCSLADRVPNTSPPGCPS